MRANTGKPWRIFKSSYRRELLIVNRGFIGRGLQKLGRDLLI